MTDSGQRLARLATPVGLRVLLPALLSIACVLDGPTNAPEDEPVDDPLAELAELEAPTLEAPTLAIAEPDPAPIVPATPEQIAEALAYAEQQIDALGIRAKLKHTPSGPLPEQAFLAAAYDERRAFAISGDLEQVRGWMALAKFGSDAPGAAPGLESLARHHESLARYDLIVTRKDDKAWLHVVIPAQGLPPAPQRGRHEAFVDGERWVNLADRLQPGQHYLPYKSNGKESQDRQWGRVDVIESLATIADEYQQRTGLLLGIGDISHVTGGKIPDHWTHREGVDADVYLLDLQHVDDTGRPRVWWHHFRKTSSIWSSEPLGKGEREDRLDPEDELSDTPSSQRLRVLAQIVFPLDPIAYFVHDDPRVLSSFDREVAERRPGRRFLHAQNRGMWPQHCDHVHLRWVDGNLPVDGTPRP